MTNAEATITENAATVAEQGAHVAPEKTSPKKGVPKGKKSAKGGKAKTSPKKEAKAGKKAKPAPVLTRYSAGFLSWFLARRLSIHPNRNREIGDRRNLTNSRGGRMT
jgi:hypothetical protein